MEHLREFAENVWMADGPVVREMGTYFTTRRTIVKLSNGAVWISSPVRVSYDALREIAELGERPVPSGCRSPACLASESMARFVPGGRVVGIPPAVIHPSNRTAADCGIFGGHPHPGAAGRFGINGIPWKFPVLNSIVFPRAFAYGGGRALFGVLTTTGPRPGISGRFPEDAGRKSEAGMEAFPAEISARRMNRCMSAIGRSGAGRPPENCFSRHRSRCAGNDEPGGRRRVHARSEWGLGCPLLDADGHWTGTFLVPYLRNCFRSGGFPGRKGKGAPRRSNRSGGIRCPHNTFGMLSTKPRIL
jgi:hypothetical protein